MTLGNARSSWSVDSQASCQFHHFWIIEARARARARTLVHRRIGNVEPYGTVGTFI